MLRSRFPSMTPVDPPTPPAVHALEAEVMEQLWRRDRASVREVMDAVNAAAPKKRAYTTYLTTLSRLDDKALVARAREGKTDFYSALYTRERYNDLRARAE